MLLLTIMRKHSKYIQSILLLVIFVFSLFLSPTVSSRKHNSYRRFYKKAAYSNSPQSQVTTRPDFYGSPNIYTTVSYPQYGTYRHSQTWATPNNRKLRLKKGNSSKYQMERRAPYEQHEPKPSYGEEVKYGYGHHEVKATEKDDTIDGLTGVIGPLLFPIPFLLAVLPFALPALPIALLLPFGNSSDGDIAEGRMAQPIEEIALNGSSANNGTKF